MSSGEPCEVTGFVIDKPSRIFRFRYQLRGGHYHLRVFSGTPDQTFAKMGDLVMDVKDFARLQENCRLTGDEVVED